MLLLEIVLCLDLERLRGREREREREIEKRGEIKKRRRECDSVKTVREAENSEREGGGGKRDTK